MSSAKGKLSFYIDKTIREAAPRARLGVIVFEGVTVGFGHSSLDEMRVRIANRIRDEFRSYDAIRMNPQIAGLDGLLAKFDPDMRRAPSRVELLVRKIIENGPMPVENDAIDLSVLLTLYYKLPVFIADRTELKDQIGLVVGKPGRFEVSQGQEPIRTEGRLFIADDFGYFASPLAVGKRAIVTERTSEIVLIALFPENVGDSIVQDFVRRGGNWIEGLCGGQIVQEGMVGQAENAAK